MKSHADHNTHPVLLTIAALAFIVLFFLGVNLFTAASGHATAEHALTVEPQKTH